MSAAGNIARPYLCVLGACHPIITDPSLQTCLNTQRFHRTCRRSGPATRSPGRHAQTVLFVSMSLIVTVEGHRVILPHHRSANRRRHHTEVDRDCRRHKLVHWLIRIWRSNMEVQCDMYVVSASLIVFAGLQFNAQLNKGVDYICTIVNHWVSIHDGKGWTMSLNAKTFVLLVMTTLCRGIYVSRNLNKWKIWHIIGCTWQQ